MDNILGDGIGRRCLRAEDGGYGALWKDARLDPPVLADDPKQIQLLAFVLVQALGLHVEHGIRINHRALMGEYPVCEAPLVRPLHRGQPGQERLVPGMPQQLFKLPAVPAPSRADGLVDQTGQRGIAAHQPAAKGNAVGLVVERLVIDFIERRQLRIFQDLGVQPGHAVYGMTEVDVQIRHMYVTRGVDDLHERIVEFRAHPPVQPPDDRHQVGHRPLKIGHGPLLQRLRKNGMVGVAAHAAHDRHCLVLADAPLAKQANQLGNHQGRVGIVDLDGGIVRQIAQVASPGFALLQDQSRGVGDHKVLLVHAQQTARVGAVVRIQKERQVLCQLSLVKGDARLHQTLVGGIYVKQAQPAALAVVAGYVDLIHRRAQRRTANGDIIVDAGAAHPALGAPAQPQIRGLRLPVVLKALAKQAAVIGQPDAVRRQAQRREAVQKAGRQPPQAAVAQGGLKFKLFQLRKSDALGGQLGAHLVEQAQIDQIVAEQLSDQEFGGDIVQLFLSFIVAAIPGCIARIAQQRVEQLKPGALAQGFAGIFANGGIAHSAFLHVGRTPPGPNLLALYSYFSINSCSI